MTIKQPRALPLVGMNEVLINESLIGTIMRARVLCKTRFGAFSAELSSAHGTWVFLLLSVLILIFMGSVLEGAAALIIFGPLLVPVAGQLGIAPLQRAATLGADGYWHVDDVPLSRPGRWHLRIDALTVLQKIKLEDDFDVPAR